MNTTNILLVVLLVGVLSGCAGVKPAVRPASWAQNAEDGDLRDAAASYPPTSPGEALYRKMLAMPPLESSEFSMLMSSQQKEELLGYMLRTKGEEAYWSWKFRLYRDLSQRERDFIQWYLSEYTSYLPVPQQ